MARRRPGKSPASRRPAPQELIYAPKTRIKARLVEEVQDRDDEGAGAATAVDLDKPSICCDSDAVADSRWAGAGFVPVGRSARMWRCTGACGNGCGAEELDVVLDGSVGHFEEAYATGSGPGEVIRTSHIFPLT